MRRQVITIDGPAGAGKSTIARRLARDLGFEFLDTGAMYRAVTWKVLEEGVDPEDLEGVTRVAREIAIDWDAEGALRVGGRVVGDDIRTAAVTAAVSAVSAIPAVRAAMVPRQRERAEHRDLVVEGRDTGSVVFPDAPVRFYLDASSVERARRRAEELRAGGQKVDEDDLRRLIEARDHADSTRADSPLRRLDGMTYVDTTGRDFDQVLEILRGKVLDSLERPN